MRTYTRSVYSVSIERQPSRHIAALFLIPPQNSALVQTKMHTLPCGDLRFYFLGRTIRLRPGVRSREVSPARALPLGTICPPSACLDTRPSGEEIPPRAFLGRLRSAFVCPHGGQTSHFQSVLNGSLLGPGASRTRCRTALSSVKLMSRRYLL